MPPPQRLSPRLRTALNACDLDKPVWDVGCDHGALGIAALLAGAPHVHFVDRVPGIVAALALKMPLGISEAHFTFHCADAETWTQQVDGNLIVCGMGGQRIANIVSNLIPNAPAVSRVIYDAHGDGDRPAATLRAMGWVLDSERDVNERGRTRTVTCYRRARED